MIDILQGYRRTIIGERRLVNKIKEEKNNVKHANLMLIKKMYDDLLEMYKKLCKGFIQELKNSDIEEKEQIMKFINLYYFKAAGKKTWYFNTGLYEKYSESAFLKKVRDLCDRYDKKRFQ